jgi:tyrosinase
MAIQRFSNIDFPKWPEFRNALQTLIDDGIYQQLVAIHADMLPPDPDGYTRSRFHIHGSASGPLGFRRFLPWHRAYLIMFERALRQIDPELSVPYWDWSADRGRMIGFAGLLGTATTRDPGTLAGAPPEPGRVRWFTSPDEFSTFTNFTGSYYRFANALESQPHNSGHGWIGGDMNTMSSPSDLAFWLHHAQVDRIWTLWQQLNPGERAFLQGAEAGLDPWDGEFDVTSIDDISTLGADSYEYVAPAVA